MKAVVAPQPGGPQALRIVERPDPAPAPGELLVRVVATSVNRADILQREGRYPPPAGASDVLGLELAGTVEALGDEVRGWAVGDEVCAVVPGGGYAELAVVPAAVALPVPPGCSLVEAGGLVEAFATAYDNLVVRPHLRAGESVLVHGGASGVGTAAIQLARRHGCDVWVTAGSAERVAACRELGAAGGVVYRDDDVAEQLLAASGSRGFDVVLDVMGASYLGLNLRVLADDGRLSIIGLQGGAKAELNLGLLMAKRAAVMGSTLRARPVPLKAELMAALRREVWPGFASGLQVVVDRVLPLEQVAEAHRIVEASQHVGKVLLTLGAEMIPGDHST